LEHSGNPRLPVREPPWVRTPAPFVWDEERRTRLGAHLYGLTHQELAYILDTFLIARRKDEERWGEYRTKRLVLEYFDERVGGMD
jgi:hypothetical protein